MTTDQPIVGIIAGAGSFPIDVAKEARRQGLRVVAIGLEGWVDARLGEHADTFEQVPIGQLGRLFDRFAAHQVREAVMAGKVTKEVLFDPRVEFDAEALQVLGQVKEFSVNGLLGAIADRLAGRGVTLLDSSTFLRHQLCPAGVLTTRQPSPEERVDIDVGAEAARQMATLDVGQTVVVRQKVIVAVEALEGTDTAIERAGKLAGAGCVVVKMASRTQDRRFDLPVLGLRTIEVAAAAGVTCLAVQAGSTLLLEKTALIEQANHHRLCLVGIEPTDPPAAR